MRWGRFWPCRQVRCKAAAEGAGIRAILAVQPSFPVFAQRSKPDGLFRLVVFLVSVVASAPQGDSDLGPAGGLVGGAGEARGFHERFDQHGRGVVTLGPVFGQMPTHDGQDVRGQVGDSDPGQDEEAGIVDHPWEVLLA